MPVILVSGIPLPGDTHLEASQEASSLRQLVTSSGLCASVGLLAGMAGKRPARLKSGACTSREAAAHPVPRQSISTMDRNERFSGGWYSTMTEPPRAL